MSNKPLQVFVGFDERQPVSYSVLQSTIFTRSSKPVSITPIVLQQLPFTRRGLTPFTYSRFLTPWLCDYEGWALFLDIDIILQADIAELFALADDKYSVMVSKNKHKFEWASVILFNCAKNKILTPEYCDKADRLHQISWLQDHEIGDLPREWNHLVGYDKPRSDAKLVHYTQGIPCFEETIDSEYSEHWHNEHKWTNRSLPWVDLMGQSVHAVLENGKRVPRYKVEPPR